MKKDRPRNYVIILLALYGLVLACTGCGDREARRQAHLASKGLTETTDQPAVNVIHVDAIEYDLDQAYSVYSFCADGVRVFTGHHGTAAVKDVSCE